MSPPSFLQASGAAARSGKAKVTSLRPLFRFMRPYHWPTLAAIMATIGGALLVLFFGSGLKYLVNFGLAAKDMTHLNQAAMVMLGMVFAFALVTYLRLYFVSYVGERVVADIREAVFQKSLSLPPSFFETTASGEVVARLTADTTLLQSIMTTSLPVVLRNIFLLLGGIFMLILSSAKLTAVVFTILIFLICPILIFGKRIRSLSRLAQDRLGALGGYANEMLQNVSLLQAYTYEDKAAEEFTNKAEAALKAALDRVKQRGILVFIVIAVVFSAITAILWLGGRSVILGHLTPGDLTSFVFFAVLVAGSIGALTDVMGELQRAAGGMERLLEILATESPLVLPASPEPLPDFEKNYAIQFQGVTFSYPSRPDQAALSDFNFTLQKGERVALVGPSGAGKTTLFHLLLRYADPQKGAIQIDGTALPDLDLRAWRDQIGLVPQEPVVFSANAWENIAYGRITARQDEITKAADLAHASEFLTKLPEGFDSFLGEKGVRLSGGQRQRLALARAILRDPPILLLDEATSALDAESERLVQQALDQVMKNRTTIVIAHRLATIRSVDRIIVMDEGKILASGRHEELLQSNELYARLAKLQFID